MSVSRFGLLQALPPSGRRGLKLTRCDCCGRRRFCAVTGTAFCGECCPGAVQEAQEQAAEADKARIRARAATVEVEPLPGEYAGPPVRYYEVAHLF